MWEPETRLVTCIACEASEVEARSSTASTSPPLDRGTPGASARRQYERRHERREQNVRDRFGRLSKVVLAVTAEPQSTRAWGVGSTGERRLGAFLEDLHDESRVFVLHDRRIPGSRVNIDHLAITRAGEVWAIDRGGWLSSDPRLYVGRRAQEGPKTFSFVPRSARATGDEPRLLVVSHDSMVVVCRATDVLRP